MTGHRQSCEPGTALLRWRSFSGGEVWVHPGRSDGSGEFAEGGSGREDSCAGFEPEFVVAAPQVLDEGMPCDDCPRCPRKVFRPRIGRSRALSLPWSHSIRLFAYCWVS